ncbi:MAG: GyrI-like domain-containing protein [Ignavibacteriae bacterium]|nr:GyrI-like domain-containing protein [Ignavibacteriota bacterium]
MDVAIRKIEPGIFISFYGYGNQPEEIAQMKCDAWCRQQHLDPGGAIVYGFNNPNPIPDSAKYGYEIWVQVIGGEEPQGDSRIVEFHGGDYAVVECVGASNMLQCWQSLYAWCIDHKYTLGYHQALEQVTRGHPDPNEMIFALYCPITL